MKKLFISVPMKGRTEEAIRESIDKMHKIAEIIVGEELELIQSYIEHDPPKTKHDSVWYLGRSLQKLADADYIVCVRTPYEWNGCNVESSTASLYGIPSIKVDVQDVAPDALEDLGRGIV